MLSKNDNLGKPKEITQQVLLRGIKASSSGSSNILYGFILGAGASVNSDIPSGVTLATKWYKEISIDNHNNKLALNRWKKSIKINESNLAEFYTDIFEKRFEGNLEEGYEELQKYMDRAIPSIGYSFLAQLLDQTNNSFVVTTNFDTMTEDALLKFTKSKPLVLGHELLSDFLNPINLQRPSIMKIHRDFLLKPYTTNQQIQDLDIKWQESLKPILKNNAMIVIGYGGHDNSLMKYLNEIEDKDRKAIYWCYRSNDEISDKAKKILTKKDFIVKINGFDEFMLLVSKALKFDLLVDINNIEKSQTVVDAIEHAKNYAIQWHDLGQTDLPEDEKEAFNNYSVKATVYDEDENGNNIYATAALDDATGKVVKYIDYYGMEFFKVNRKEVARVLHIAPETLSRRLRILEDEGIIDRNDETIDKDKLRIYIEQLT